MSGHDAHYIMRKMPLARAYQFRTAYWQTKGIAVELPTEKESPLQRRID